MSIALYIVTQREPEGIDTFVNGKAIGDTDESALDALCEAAGVPSLMNFISQDPGEFADFLEQEGFEMEDGDSMAEEWFTPAEGLAAIRGLMAHLRSNPTAIGNAAAIVEDLAEYEAVLVQLEQQDIPWHLAVDF